MRFIKPTMLSVALIFSAMSQAELINSANTFYDTQTGITWKRLDALMGGVANNSLTDALDKLYSTADGFNYNFATSAQVSSLILNNIGVGIPTIFREEYSITQWEASTITNFMSKVGITGDYSLAYSSDRKWHAMGVFLDDPHDVNQNLKKMGVEIRETVTNSGTYYSSKYRLNQGNWDVSTYYNTESFLVNSSRSSTLNSLHMGIWLNDANVSTGNVYLSSLEVAGSSSSASDVSEPIGVISLLGLSFMAIKKRKKKGIAVFTQ